MERKIGIHRQMAVPFTDREWDVIRQYSEKVGIPLARLARVSILTYLEARLKEMGASREDPTPSGAPLDERG